jgi:lactate dehydrogenase-like 2-hydroxyacid dehydrogenase
LTGNLPSLLPDTMAPVAISVSEHVVMMILGLVRNYIPSYQ